MEVRLIRHFATEGNLEKRYIGVTDEEIKTECVPEYALKKEENGRYGKKNGRAKWEPELVIVSPLRRCRQTAEILFPGAEQVVCDKMRECDFGLFVGIQSIRAGLILEVQRHFREEKIRWSSGNDVSADLKR